MTNTTAQVSRRQYEVLELLREPTPPLQRWAPIGAVLAAAAIGFAIGRFYMT